MMDGVIEVAVYDWRGRRVAVQQLPLSGQPVLRPVRLRGRRLYYVVAVVRPAPPASIRAMIDDEDGMETEWEEE